jgi:hypothetical protein
MNILLDSWSTQVLYQQAPPSLPPHTASPIDPTGLRLGTVLAAMAGVGVSSSDPWAVSYSQPPITTAQLAGIDVYVSFTRYPSSPFAYSDDELSVLQTWVGQGHGLLLLTNHGPFQHNPTSWPVNDKALAAKFGITLIAHGVTNADWMPMDLETAAPAFIANKVQGIVAHDSCVIEIAGAHTRLAAFPTAALAWNGTANVTPAHKNFAALVPYLQGNVIVVGNSGMFADYGTSAPSCGLAPMAHNLMFLLNCVGYLGGLSTIPAAGVCP